MESAGGMSPLEEEKKGAFCVEKTTNSKNPMIQGMEQSLHTIFPCSTFFLTEYLVLEPIKFLCSG